MKSFHKLLLTSVLWPLAAMAQQPPGTDIYVVLLSETGQAEPANPPVNLTRRSGYDNQPAFTPDGRGIWFTRIENGQADIYHYDLIGDSISQATDTPESEYSPTPRPGHRGFTVVRVEPDQKQRLWQFSPQGPAELLFPELEPVGYFDWHDSERIVAFILGEPVTLQSVGADGVRRTHAAEIGRAIQRLPDGRVAFVDKSESPWRVRAVEFPEGKVATLTETPGEVEDFAVGPDGAIWMGAGGKLHRWRADGGWQEIADFSGQGITEITRLAVAPDGRCVAFVADDQPADGEP